MATRNDKKADYKVVTGKNDTIEYKDGVLSIPKKFEANMKEHLFTALEKMDPSKKIAFSKETMKRIYEEAPDIADELSKKA